jgi:hypothetical protein
MPPLITRTTPENATIKLTTSSLVIVSLRNKAASTRVQKGAILRTIAKVESEKYFTVIKLITIVIFPYKVRTNKPILSLFVSSESHMIAFVFLFIMTKHITVEIILL